MKNLQRNKGFTLVELIVSIAILAFIILAVGGIMYSNNLIYRKEKADITVQGSAQDVYNKINEDIMQAKHIYLEGYVTDDKIKFTSNKIESNSVGVTPKNFLLPTDQYVLDHSTGNPSDLISLEMERSVTSREEMLATMTASDQAFYTDLLNTAESDIETKLQTCTADQVDMYRKLKFYTPAESDEIAKGLSDDEKVLYNAYSNRFRYFSAAEKSEEVTFLKSIPTKTNSDFGTLSTVESGGTMKYKYVYITKLVIVYSQKADESFMSGTNLTAYNTEKAKPEYGGKKPNDEVTVTYTFGGTGTESQIRCDYTYKYMNELDTSKYSDNNILTKQLNHATSNGTDIPGCEAQIDAEKDSIKLYLYFADKSMTYTDRGMVKIRNSYVLHDSK